jgi:hypothetical protein
MWINLHPAPANAIIADTLTSLDASLDGKSPYNIFVHPSRSRRFGSAGTTMAPSR